MQLHNLTMANELGAVQDVIINRFEDHWFVTAVMRLKDGKTKSHNLQTQRGGDRTFKTADAAVKALEQAGIVDAHIRF